MLTYIYVRVQFPDLFLNRFKNLRISSENVESNVTLCLALFLVVFASPPSRRIQNNCKSLGKNYTMFIFIEFYFLCRCVAESRMAQGEKTQFGVRNGVSIVCGGKTNKWYEIWKVDIRKAYFIFCYFRTCKNKLLVIDGEGANVY